MDTTSPKKVPARESEMERRVREINEEEDTRTTEELMEADRFNDIARMLVEKMKAASIEDGEKAAGSYMGSVRMEQERVTLGAGEELPPMETTEDETCSVPTTEEEKDAIRKEWMLKDPWVKTENLVDAVHNLFPNYEETGDALAGLTPLVDCKHEASVRVKFNFSGSLRDFANAHAKNGQVSISIGDMISHEILNEQSVLPIACRKSRVRRVSKEGKKKAQREWVDPALLDFSKILVKSICMEGECTNTFSTSVGIKLALMQKMNDRITSSEDLKSGCDIVLQPCSYISAADKEILRENMYSNFGVVNSIGSLPTKAMLRDFQPLPHGDESDTPQRLIAFKSSMVYYHATKHEDPTVRLFGDTSDPDKMKFVSMYMHDLHGMCMSAHQFLDLRPIANLYDFSLSAEPAHAANGWADYLEGGNGTMYKETSAHLSDDEEKALWEQACTRQGQVSFVLRISYAVYEKRAFEDRKVFCCNPEWVSERSARQSAALSVRILTAAEEKAEKEEAERGKEERKKQKLVTLLCANYLTNGGEFSF